MYSKAEVCFTIIVAITALWCLSPQRPADCAVPQGRVIGIADGVHPPPPMPSSFAGEPPRIELLQADGVHPPPPYPSMLIDSAEVMRADGVHPPPPLLGQDPA
jgi:hypothetical protein